ncbi:hypothetical protein BSKO_09762 [Bryopsis sp. KO-2023]|nr:hypothetical protein BSKO_09762 [Bryopsis sp. KO-2023]
MSTKANNPFTGYNKTTPDGALVGNWVEERVLHTVTGRHRLQETGKPIDTTQTGRFPAENPTSLSTRPRVLEHSEQLLDAEWLSQSQVSYQNPEARMDLLNFNTKINHIGKREKQELEELLQESQRHDYINPPEFNADLSTTTGDAFGWKVTTDKIGARVMKTMDGGPVARDPVFLVESKICKKATIDRLMNGGATQTANVSTTALQSQDVPITIYSETLAKQHSKNDGVAPNFGKNTNFSKPISDFTKPVDQEVEWGCT